MTLVSEASVIATSPAPTDTLPANTANALGFPTGSNVRVRELQAALRAVPYGGSDDGTRGLELAPAIRATVSPLVNSLRWGAVAFGLVFAAPTAAGGDLKVVVTLSVCLFLTSWRTALPLRLGSRRPLDVAVAIVDTAILGAAIGVSAGLSSPFAYCLMIAIAVVAFGWGFAGAIAALLSGFAAMLVAIEASGDALSGWTQQQVGVLVVIVAVAAVSVAVRYVLVDAERRRASLVGRVGALAETNDLLTLLNSMARSLPTSLNLREALEGVRDQVRSTFDADAIGFVEYVEGSGEWVPKLSDNCVIRPTMAAEDMPEPLRAALAADSPVLYADLPAGEGMSPASRSGVYARLVSRGATVGVLGVESTMAGAYGVRERRLLAGLADVVALTFDNARWFGRLRSLGAESERVRIARDLHDRLGQWLTYISLELERVNLSAPDPELVRLHGDVVSAIDELRETLRQLRTGVTQSDPLAQVASELVSRFEERSGLRVHFEPRPDQERLTVPVENEILRILQEALNNVERHADATTVTVRWVVNEGVGMLEVVDDGRGFNVGRGIRDNAYGLVGMRERADVIGARLTLESSPGHGTSVRLITGPASREGSE